MHSCEIPIESQIMKRSIAALTALAAASGFAQSNLTLSGQLDVSAASTSSRSAGQKIRINGVYPSGMASSFLRFEGREDLGGGLYSTFRLEAGLNLDTGTGFPTNTNNQRSGAVAASGLTFNRWAYVGLGSRDLGEIRIGRVYTAAFENYTPFDPFTTNGVGSSTPISLRLGQRNTPTALNVSNAVEYLTPGYGQGFFGRLTLALGENPSSGTLAAGNPRRAGDHQAVRIGYASGPVSVAYSAGITHNTAGRIGTANNQGDYINTNLAARYDMGWLKLLGQYVTEELEGASAAGGNLTGVATHEAKTRTLLLGAVVPVGVGNIKLSHVNGRLSDNIGSTGERGKLFAIGYDYYFSMRTNAYTVISRVRNNAAGNYGFAAGYVTPGQGQSSTGIAVGLKHIF
jgi:predicted porin